MKTQYFVWTQTLNRCRSQFTGSRLIAFSLAVLAQLQFGGDASAQIFYSWANPNGGDYGNSINWSPGIGAPPDVNDGAEFGVNATYTVDFFTDYLLSDAYVSAGSVTWDLGQGSELQHIYSVDTVDVNSGAQLRFFDGILLANTMNISGGADVLVLGADRNDAANITVTGAGSTLTHDNFLEIADYRPETLTIENGASVVSGSGSVGNDPFFDSEGIVNVIGAGSSWSMGVNNIDIGDASRGTLNISNGGAVASRFGNIGFAGEGTVNVSGVGSKWTNTNDLYVSRDKDGTLNITAGGTVMSVNGLVGSGTGADGTVLVSGVGSTWTNSGQLTVGDTSETTGRLTIAAGGKVSNVNGVIGEEGVLSDFPAAIGTVEVMGTDSMWINSGDLTVGREGIGTLNISDGAKVSNNVGNVAFLINSKGEVAVSGAGSIWTNTGILHVGRQGDGTLRISDGGKVTTSIAQVGGSNFSQPGTGAGEVRVSGAGSTFTSDNNMHIGFLGKGALTIDNGGKVSNDNGFVAFFTGSTGAAIVTGPGSTWENRDSLTVGSVGYGVLLVENGGAVTNTDGHVGSSSTALGVVTVRDAGSKWNMSGDLFLGAQGSATLNIENGGIVSSNTGNLGRAGGTPFGSGYANVTGIGSSWAIANEIRVGNNGTGELNILDGGKVSNTTAYVATTSGSTGTVTVAGNASSWNVAGRLSVGGDVTASTGGGNGTLEIKPGGTVTVAQDTTLFPSGIVRLHGGTFDSPSIAVLGAGGQFQFMAGTLHVGLFNGNLLNQGGNLSPGHSAGLTTVVGNYTQQAAGKLDMEIGGPSAFDSDIVNVLGIASLNGNLQLTMINGFVPDAGQTFSILQATSLAGVFGNVANGQRLATYDDRGSFRVNYGNGSAFNPNQIVLSNFLANPLPGDFNDDGSVDAADFLVWRKSDLGPAAYSTWREYFGRTATSAIGSGGEITIPEPAAILLIAVGLAGLSSRRPRRQVTTSVS